MRAYRFRLATVARIRILEERVARDAFAVTIRDLRHARDAEHAAFSSLRDLAAPTGVLGVDEVVFAGDQARRLHDALVSCRATTTDCAVASEVARRQWTAASRRAGVLEQLDAEARVRWRDESQRDEMSELDDLINARFERRAVSP